MQAELPTNQRAPFLSQNTSYQSIILPCTPSKNGPSPSELRWILTAICCAVFLVGLDATVVATLLTSIGSDFKKANEASYLGTSYLLSVCCFTPLYGKSSDIIGRKGALLVALSLFSLGTVLSGLAPSMGAMIATRAVAGMGGGGVRTVATIVLTDLVPLRNCGLYQGYINVTFAIGAGLGGPLGGFIAGKLGWRWAFLCQTPILVASLILVATKLSTEPSIQQQSLSKKLKRMDFLGAITLVLALCSLLLAVTLGTSGVPRSPTYVWGLVLSFVLFTAAFIYVEECVALEPIMSLRLLWKRTPMAVAMSNFLIGIVAFSMVYNVPIYFTAVRLVDSTHAGLSLLLYSLALVLGSIMVGFVMRKSWKVHYLSLASASLVLLSSLLVLQWNENSSTWHYWLDIIPGGLGVAGLVTVTLVALMATVGKENIAVATGFTFLFRNTGQVLGVSLTGALLQGVLLKNLQKNIVGPGSSEIIRNIIRCPADIPSLDPKTRAVAVESYATALRMVFIVQSALALLSVLACLPIEGNPLPSSHEDEEKAERGRENPDGSI